MTKIRVLHITPWFPNAKNRTEGVFIAEHIRALNNYCINHVLHINFGKKKEEYKEKFQNISIDRVTLKPILNKWLLKEKLATKTIKAYLLKNNTEFDIVNFHITYPNAINIKKIASQFTKLKFCMMEHWSAYHTNFHLPEGNKGRLRIEKIFKNNIPLFVVSNALGQDIQSFTKNRNRSFSVIPNCINGNEFNYKVKTKSNPFRFTSINNWTVMKNPIVLIKAFQLLRNKYANVRLTLVGDGVLIPEMKKLVTDLKIEQSVEFKGKIPKDKVANELHKTSIYCQSSNYETFSVICIESLSTGTPVIATKIGGMLDFINSTNGILVQGLEVNNWFLALEKTYLNYSDYDNEKIAIDCKTKFNSTSIGELYFSKLNNIYSEK